MASKSSSSTSGGSSAGSDEEDFGGDLAERYCEAITKLTPDIVAVLKNEIKIVLSKAFAKGLIGDDMYNTGITLQSDSQQASQLLSMVKAQIKLKLSFYPTFLGILRSTAALEHVADRIAQEVTHLEKKGKEKKTKQKKRCRNKKSRKRANSSASSSAGGGSGGRGHRAGAADMPKLDLHNDNDKTRDEGFQSESVSTTVAGSDVAETPPNHVASMRSTNYSEEPDQNNSDIQLETVTPLQTSEEVGEGGGGGGAAIHSGVEVVSEETTGENTDIVYQSQQSIGDTFEKIVQCAKKKTQDIVAEMDVLQNRLEVMEAQHNKEMRKKEEELSHCVADIEKKSNDIIVLKKMQKCKIEQLEEKHKCEIEQLEVKHKEKMAQLNSKFEKKGQQDQQKIGELEEELQQAKQALEREKAMAKEELEEERKKHEEERKQLEIHYSGKIRRLESDVENAKQKEEFLKMQYRCDLSEKENENKDKTAALKERIHELEKKNIEAEANVKIYEERMKTEKERAEKEKALLEADRGKEIALLEADRGKEIALREQAQDFEKENSELWQALRSLSSGSVSSTSSSSITQEEYRLSLSMSRMSISRATSTGNQSVASSSGGSMQPTPGQDDGDKEPSFYIEN